MKLVWALLFVLVGAPYRSISAQGVSEAGKTIAPDPAAAWAAAYTFYVSRVCPIYRGDTDAMSASGALPVDGAAPEWGEHGAARLAFHAGGVAAETAAALDPSLCAHPLVGAGTYAPLVGRFLKPRPPNG